MNYKGIDVSYCNGSVNWNIAKNGLDFAILQLGYGSDSTNQDDCQFKRNVSECERLHIPWGAYLYSYAMNESNVYSELNHALRLLKGHHPTYPIFIDLEDADGYKGRNGGIPSARVMTNIAKIFCSGIVKAGYKAGYYCNRDWYYNHLYPTELKQYSFWYARPEVSAPDIKCDIWQNAFGENTGRWNGANISGKGCDTNISYTNYGAVKESLPQIHYAPFGSGFKCDTTTTVHIKQGSKYTVRIDCVNGRPTLIAGSNHVIKIDFKSQSGNAYYFDITANGKVGQATGVYINGSKISTFIVKVDTIIDSDTTVNVNKQVGQCYTVGLKCSNRPTVTLGTNGIATLCGIYQDGDKWLCPIVGYKEGTTGVYTSVNDEPPVKRFEFKVSK